MRLGLVWGNPLVAATTGAVHVGMTRRRYTAQDGTSRGYAAHLVRRSYREDGQVKTQTVGNISALPDAAIEAVRAGLRGEALVSAGAPGQAVQRVRSRARTGIWPRPAVLAGKLDMAGGLGPGCPEPELVMAPM